MAKEKRFEVIYIDSRMIEQTKILKDSETGVCYLYHGTNGSGGGLTPLLDKEGKPVIEPPRFGN